MLRFFWWEEVYYKLYDSSFPSNSTERKGNFFGIVEHVRHYMTFKVLDIEIRRVLPRINPQYSEDPNTYNWRLEDLLTPSSKTAKDFIAGKNYISEGHGEAAAQMPTFDTADLVGKKFLLPKDDETGERFRANFISAIDNHGSDLSKDPEKIKFGCSVNDEQYEDVMSYNDIMTCLNDDEEEERVWKFKRIISHQGPETLIQITKDLHTMSSWSGRMGR